MRKLRTEKSRFAEREKERVKGITLLADLTKALYIILYIEQVIKYGFAFRDKAQRMMVRFGG